MIHKLRKKNNYRKYLNYVNNYYNEINIKYQ